MDLVDKNLSSKKLFSTTKLYQTILLWYGVTVVTEFAYANFYNGFDWGHQKPRDPHSSLQHAGLQMQSYNRNMK